MTTQNRTDTFSTDIAGLDEVAPTTVVALSDGDVFDMSGLSGLSNQARERSFLSDRLLPSVVILSSAYRDCLPHS